MKDFKKIGIIGAMQEEIASLKTNMKNPICQTIAGREYVSGELFGKDCVVVFSRWGKVAAASTATTLINTFQVDCIIFTGVAGAVSPDLNIGDVVLGTHLYQHDMDAAPLFPKREIPYLNRDSFHSDERLFGSASEAAQTFFASAFFSQPHLKEFSIESPRIHHGIIASGDQFVSGLEKTQSLHQEVPGTLAVEMEGAAVAQVCHEHEIPCMIIRTISDRADHAAPIDFPKFVTSIATHYSMGIVEAMFKAETAEVSN
jgi:adenosylhomocysteine nucleosidase